MKPESRLPTILLVEDNIDDYDAAIRSFKAAHLDNPVHWSRTGGDALDYLKSEGTYAQSPSRELPGLILLDLNMPGLDGKAVLESTKQNPKLKKIPIIILTTSSDERDVQQCYELGASTYIQKPVSFDGLINAVQHLKDYWFGIAILPGGSPWKTL
jgi:two-component system response regulator